MGLKVIYDTKRADKCANKKNDINRIIIPHCVTENKFDSLEARQQAKEEFDALIDDINEHITQKIVTVVGCDTLQAANQIIDEFIECAKTDISCIKNTSESAPWKTQEKWQVAEGVARKRGKAWYEFNKDIIQKLKGVEEAAYKTWDELKGQAEVIQRAYENNTHEFKEIIHALATKNTNRILSSDETISKNKDLFQQCKAEVEEIARLYLLNEAAKIYNWMDKYDTLFYRTEDKDVKSMFTSLRQIAEDNNLKISLRLIDYRIYDNQKRLEAEAKKEQNKVKPTDKVQTIGNFGRMFNDKISTQKTKAVISPPSSPERKKRRIPVKFDADNMVLSEREKSIIANYRAAKALVPEDILFGSISGMLNGMSRSNSLSSSPDLEDSLLNFDGEASDNEMANHSFDGSGIDLETGSDNEENSFSANGFSMSS
ncbi:MAG: hypothetical protein K0S11_1030 [Gammaproteobacteria bacterium]|nr:hypothetical protein [Gammaproteobacteria bacterium]